MKGKERQKGVKGSDLPLWREQGRGQRAEGTVLSVLSVLSVCVSVQGRVWNGNAVIMGIVLSAPPKTAEFANKWRVLRCHNRLPGQPVLL